MIEDWTREVDNGKGIDCIYLDLRKAFDSVPHRRLLEKVKAFGIPVETSTWIQNFLCGRRQCVDVNGIISDWTDVTSWIPQGSVLGPMLFILYINDLPEHIKCKSLLFADDTKAYTATDRTNNNVNNSREQLQLDLDELASWSNKWLLRFNEEKCKTLKVCQQTEDNWTYKMGNVNLADTKVEKDIGVYMDNNLDFKHHIYTTTMKANKLVGLIRRSFKHLDGNIFSKLFKAIVRPHLEYGNTIWFPHLKYLMDEVEDVQRRATKQLPGMDNISYEERLKNLKLPNLLYRRIRVDMIECFKILKNIYDPSIKHPLQLNKSDHNTRGHYLKLKKQQIKLDKRKYCFSVRITKLWNSLPSDVVSAENLVQFERRLDSYFKAKDIEFSYERSYEFFKLWYNKP